MTVSETKTLEVYNKNRVAPHRFDEEREGPPQRRYPLTLNMVPPKRTMAFASLKRNLLIGLGVLVVMVGGVSTLVARTVIAGAVVTGGILVVETGPKAVQHPTGGIVKDLLVRSNQDVTQGQPLIILDTTLAEAQLEAAETNLVQQTIRLERLTAERDGLDKINLSDGMRAAMIDPRYRAIIESEMRQFVLRREEREGRRAQLRERKKQAEEEINGTLAQLDAREQEVELATREFESLRSLYARKLITQQRYNDMERGLVQLKGAAGALRASIAAGRGKLFEIELMINQVDQSLRSEITNEIAAARESIASLTEKRIAAETSIKQSVIRAPQTGIVHELAVQTVGGVVRSADTLMMIVPRDDKLVGEIRVLPSDIDQVYPGQQVTITFSAFDRGTTPQISGKLSSVSPDLEEHAQTGLRFYRARIAVDDDQSARLGSLSLVPGMPIEVFIKTGDRTLVSYFLKPLTDQMNRAFR